MIVKKSVMLLLLAMTSMPLWAQINNADKDQLFIQEVENKTEPDKVLHAEPLYIDLIRDLGARKGEHEWNFGFGLTDNLEFDSYEALVEYEWAPIDRLGLEVELPFTFYSPGKNGSKEATPNNRLNGLKLAAQWTFLVNQKAATSMALGYINEMELSDFKNFGAPLLIGNVYNPFVVIAKRWGTNFHSLLYTGPMFTQHFDKNQWHNTYEINTSFHYMISGTKNFVGIEINQSVDEGKTHTVLRPQMRVGFAENLLIGIVTGIPINKENERLSTFLRLIWEPKHH